MEHQEPTEFILDVFTDPRSVRDVVKGKRASHAPRHPTSALSSTLQHPRSDLSASITRILFTDKEPGILHTIFFHRFFPSISPVTHDVLDLTLPYVDDDELETMIDQRAAALERQLESERSSSIVSGTAGGRGQMAVQFFEKKRRKATWLSRGDDEVCWECWTVKVTVAEPRTESGKSYHGVYGRDDSGTFGSLQGLRASKGSTSDGADAADVGDEDCYVRQFAQRPHPAYHDADIKSLPV